MIIPQVRQRLDGNRVPLEKWLRAPLSLNESCALYSVHEVVREPVSSTEIVISTIHPSHWLDLWRVEIETYDTPGVLSVIYEILNKYSLVVLASEGSVNTFGEVNTMAFVVSAISHRSAFDGDTLSRSQQESCTLSEFELALKLNLLKEVTLNEKGWPKISVKRFDVYRRLAQNISPQGVREFGSLRGEYLSNGCYLINERALTKLQNWIAPDLLYTAHADTKMRLIRLHFFSKQSPYAHIQLLLEREQTGCLQQVFGHIARLNGNVVKYQVRSGGNRLTESSARLSRVDITFGPSEGATIKPDVLLDKLRVALNEDEALALSNLKILKVHLASDAMR